MGLQWVVWGFLYLLGHYVHLLVAVQGLWSIEPDLNVELLCDWHGFHYTVSKKLQKLHSVQFRALDQEGLSTVISNSSVCGTSVVIQPCGSVLLQAAYNSCYALDQEDHYIMSILVERDYDQGRFMSPEMKELVCPKLPVTVQCTHDGQMSVAISKHLTKPALRLHSIHVKNGKAAVCGPVFWTDELVLFQFSLFTCGTTSKERDGKVIYENVVVADINVRKKIANAKQLGHQLRVQIQCTLEPNDLTTQNRSDAPMPPSGLDDGLHLPGLQMRFAKDDRYREFYTDQNPSVLNLHHTTIPIEVRILQNEDSNMTLVLHECWATPTRDPNHQSQWPILTNGCPYLGENYESWYAPPMGSHDRRSASHYRRFIIRANSSGSPPSQMSLHGMVYFHCHVYMSFPSMLEHHMLLCHKRHRRSTEANFSGNGMLHNGVSNMSILVSSHVPVYFPATRESTQITGSPVHSGTRDREWVRITIVVSALVAILMVVFVSKKCNSQN